MCLQRQFLTNPAHLLTWVLFHTDATSPKGRWPLGGFRKGCVRPTGGHITFPWSQAVSPVWHLKVIWQSMNKCIYFHYRKKPHYSTVFNCWLDMRATVQFVCHLLFSETDIVYDIRIMNCCPLDRQQLNALHVTCSQPIRGQYFQARYNYMLWGPTRLYQSSFAVCWHSCWDPQLS